MPDYQQGQPSQPGGLPGCLLGVFGGMGYSMEAWLHEDIGERRIRDMGGPLLLAVGTLALLSLLVRTPAQTTSVPPGAAWYPVNSPLGYGPTPSQDPTDGLPSFDDLARFAPLIFSALITLAHVRHRLRAWKHRGKAGPPTHSYYSGFPNMLKGPLRFIPGMTELKCKRYVEPSFVIVCGVLLLHITPLLGLYLLLAGGILGLSVHTRLYQERELVLDTYDGMIDMLSHQENVRTGQQPQSQQPASARAVVPACGPQATPVPDGPPKRPKPRAATSPAVPPALCEGLNENLRSLLREKHTDD